MNKVELMGRLTHDPDTRSTPNGIMLTRFSIAVNRRFAGKDAEQTADFINCVAWRKTGEFISRYFRKGKMIAVVGHLQTDSWDGNDGKRHYSTVVVVDEAYFTGSKTETVSTDGAAHQTPSGNVPQFGDNLGDEYPDFDGIGEDDLPY